MRRLSAYGSLSVARSDALALARTIYVSCLELGIDVPTRDFWMFFEPFEIYYGEFDLIDKLQRSQGATLEPLTPYAHTLYQPKTAALTAEGEISALEAAEVESENRHEQASSGTANPITPRYGPDETVPIQQVRR